MTIYQAPRIKKIDYIVCKDFFSEANRVLDSSDNELNIKLRANFIINKYIMKFDCISHYDKVRDELISSLLKGGN